MRIKRILENISSYIVLLAYLVVCIFPLIWTVMGAFKTAADATAIPPAWIFKPTLVNWERIFYELNYGRILLNSTIIACIATGLSLIVGTGAAYAFDRFRIRGSGTIMFWILSLRMAPPIAFVIPYYIIFSTFKLLDTQLAVSITHTTFILPFLIWLTRSYIAEVPKELDEAAKIDGCSTLGVLSKVILPIVAPGLIATTIISIIFSWNEFMFAMILTGTEARTLPVAIAGFQTDRAIWWGQMAAALTLGTLPVLVFAMIVQRHLVKGLTFGAVKG